VLRWAFRHDGARALKPFQLVRECEASLLINIVGYDHPRCQQKLPVRIWQIERGLVDFALIRWRMMKIFLLGIFFGSLTELA
jgi:hypothetical protein